MKQITRSSSATRAVAPDCPAPAFHRAFVDKYRALPEQCRRPDGLTTLSRHIGSQDFTLLATPDSI